MRDFLAALANLTVFPVGSFFPTEEELRRSIRWYPVVGMVVALLLAPVTFGIFSAFPPALAAVFMTIIPEGVTKCFHLDGLADTADAFLSGRDRTRKLEIMKDSRIGTMGTAALVALLALKTASLVEMSAMDATRSIVLAAIGGRCAIVWYISLSHYARPEGLGRIIFERRSIGAPVIAGVVWITTCLGLLGPLGAIPTLLLPLAAFLWSQITKRVIGGATGDTVGAMEEFAELLVLLTASLAISP